VEREVDSEELDLVVPLEMQQMSELLGSLSLTQPHSSSPI